MRILSADRREKLAANQSKIRMSTGPRLLGQAMSSCLGVGGDVQHLEDDCNRAPRCGRDAAGMSRTNHLLLVGCSS